ncbi:hypothetical protein [Microbacterium sp. A1-JK]|uniref:hypothetical protein n=1 Tax=Microbacterium sp. A1-JK TaxID=3177516 RepID=UPI003886DE3F
MIRSATAERAIAARADWAVARLLVGLGLVVVLLMGCWAATHSETEDLAVAPVAELIVTNEPVPVAAVTTGGDAGEAGYLGALCLLGVACALALVVLAWRARSRSCSVERVAGMVRGLIAVPPSRMPVLTLTQLGVSRT